MEIQRRRIYRLIKHFNLLWLVFGSFNLLAAQVIWSQNKQLPQISRPCYHLFCDLGGVALQRSKFKITLNNIGLFTILAYGLRHGKIPDQAVLQGRMFEFMDYLYGAQNTDGVMYNGYKLPVLICRMMTGDLAATTLVQLVCDAIDHDHTFFKSKIEKILLKRVVCCLEPETLCRIHYVDQNVRALLCNCQEQCDLYVLSNWDLQSGEKLTEFFPNLMSLFAADHIFISAKIGYLKPQPAVFNKLVTACNLDPAHCILIDDQIENVTAARQCGWQAILHTNVESTRQQLMNLGIKFANSCDRSWAASWHCTTFDLN